MVEIEVQGLVLRHGVERIGFLTFTFADDVKDVKEASRRMNSLLTNQLSARYPEWLSVVQRHKDGRIHFHFVVVMAEDIRTGFNHGQVARRDYTSASAYLRREWQWLRATLPEYRFGRHELLPVKVADGFGRYVARYVAGNTKRQSGDAGSRLVRFSRSFVRTVLGPFVPWNFVSRRVSRRKEELVRQWPSLAGLIGRSWLPEALPWLPWLLWRADDWWWVCCWGMTADDLQFYGGAEFALRENAMRLHAEWTAREKAKEQGAGVEATPVRPLAVDRALLPGELFLLR